MPKKQPKTPDTADEYRHKLAQDPIEYRKTMLANQDLFQRELRDRLTEQDEKAAAAVKEAGEFRTAMRETIPTIAANAQEAATKAGQALAQGLITNGRVTRLEQDSYGDVQRGTTGMVVSMGRVLEMVMRQHKDIYGDKDTAGEGKEGIIHNNASLLRTRLQIYIAAGLIGAAVSGSVFFFKDRLSARMRTDEEFLRQVDQRILEKLPDILKAAKPEPTTKSTSEHNPPDPDP